MGCGASKNSVHAIPSSTAPNATEKNTPPQQPSANAPLTPIIKNSPPMKSALASSSGGKKRPSSQERSSKKDMAHSQGNSSPLQQSTGTGLLPQKNSVRWKTDEENGKDDSITRSRSQSITASPSISAKGSSNHIIVPDSHQNSPRMNNTNASALDVVVEQNSLSSFHLSDGPGSPNEKSAHNNDIPGCVVVSPMESLPQKIQAAPDTDSQLPQEINNSGEGANGVDEEAAEKIRALLRAQLARKANRSTPDATVAKGIPRKSSSPSLRSRDGLSQSGSNKDVTASSQKQSPMLIPNSSSYMSMKRHGTGTTSLTGESHINSEGGSQSDDIL